MSITFRDRKNHKSIDAGFELMENRTISPLTKHWHVGDAVSVCFTGQSDKISAIRNDAPDQIFVSDDGFISIECVVVRRYHSCVWRDVGILAPLQDSSIQIEATSGLMEDLLLWIVKGTVPAWVNTEST